MLAGTPDSSISINYKYFVPRPNSDIMYFQSVFQRRVVMPIRVFQVGRLNSLAGLKTLTIGLIPGDGIGREVIPVSSSLSLFVDSKWKVRVY